MVVQYSHVHIIRIVYSVCHYALHVHVHVHVHDTLYIIKTLTAVAKTVKGSLGFRDNLHS